MGSLVKTKTKTKLCNLMLHFSDWKSMGSPLFYENALNSIGYYGILPIEMREESVRFFE